MAASVTPGWSGGGQGSAAPRWTGEAGSALTPGRPPHNRSGGRAPPGLLRSPRDPNRAERKRPAEVTRELVAVRRSEEFEVLGLHHEREAVAHVERVQPEHPR